MNKEISWIAIWIAIAIISAIVEGLTVSVVSCWFAVGAVFAVGAYLLGASPLIQFVVFVVVSALALAIIRPIIKKHNKTSVQPTNADMLIGKEGVVTEAIDNVKSKGAVKIKGLEWSAISENGEAIEKESIVLIKRIEGNKLIVTPVKDSETTD